MIRMMDLSNMVNCFLYRFANSPQNRCNAIPRITGSSIFTISSTNVSPRLNEFPRDSKNRPIHNGVMKIPIKPEILALKIAPGIFPLAIETITTEEETVEGKAARKKIANQSVKCASVCINGKIIKVSNGKNKNVESWIKACSFQFAMPAFIFSGLNFKP